MKKILTTSILSFCVFVAFGMEPTYSVKIDQVKNASAKPYFKLGTAVNPDGESLLFNAQSVVKNGQPILPVMGEIHFSRCPQADWKKELLKMKAGGITVVATYVFWIHHEEVEGQFRWDGQRNLRLFVQTCQEVGLPLVLRLGPWCHGEVRNGGMPEWLVTSGIKLRNSNPAYLEKVQTWFSQQFEQVKGLMWKDGGPVIGVQLENEYRGPGAHLMTLKKMAQDIGFDVPLYTRTGWPALTAPIPFGEIIPLFGDYPDGFWDRSLLEMPGDYSKGYLFRSFRNSTVIATEMLPKQSDKDNGTDMEYPYLTCELGGGMMTSYHRRIRIDPMDVYAMALVKVGSGSNLPGYYMYHGGTNPEGALTTLSEMQNSKLTNNNDLPIKSYDFQAPLGEFGQINPQYHLLRKLHLFLKDFGGDLTRMPAHFPEPQTQDANKDSLLRWSVRSDGESGFVFVNNYQRLKALTPKTNVKFTIDLGGKQLAFPEKPMTIPSGSSFFLPFNLKLGAIRLIHSTTQPLANFSGKGESVYVFSSITGIAPEFAFDAAGLTVVTKRATYVKRNGQLLFKSLKTGTGAALQLRDVNKRLITILLLNEEESLRFWKSEAHVFVSNADLTFQGDQLELTGRAGDNFNVGIYPAPTSVKHLGKLIKGKSKGQFTEYNIQSPAQSKVNATLMPVKAEDPNVRIIGKGKAGVTEMPSDADFDKAAVWNVVLPKQVDASRDLILQIPYTGDVARIYLDGKLLTDNFFNGKTFEPGLRRYAPDIYQKELTLKILPLVKDAPIYLPKNAVLDDSKANYALSLKEIKVVENTCVRLTVE